MRTSSRLKVGLLALAGVRGVIGLLAIPLAPFLYEHHFIVLVLMRPTKEVMLAGGFLLRLGDVGIVPLLAAAIPLSIFGVWQFYLLGRQYADQIEKGKLPKWAKRILDRDRLKTMQKLLDRKGPRLVLLGRVAAFPSTVVAAAAGSGDMSSREFLPMDGIGALLSMAEVLGAGYLLGDAYKKAGPWITVVGVAVLVAIAVVIARFLRRQ